ncbi:MAG: 4-(cytidine 5'-diphospho)-2-C-methyl-D-erythritol kinase [Thermodesulfobacteriota bacterium]
MCFIKVLSPAKVNLTLQILGKREDGLHLIKSIFQPIDLFDEVSIMVKEGEGVELSSLGIKVPTDEINLAVKAARAYLLQAALKKKVIIELNKRIPVGSGLGGGSGNAASVLVGLNKLFGRLHDKVLIELAGSIGTDVIFFVRSVTSLVEGIGEKITVLADFPLFYYVILFPRINISTKTVYEKWDKDADAFSKETDNDLLIQKFKIDDDLPLENDLEKPASKLYPEIQTFKEIFYSLGAKSVLMSGSGSSVFAAFRTEREATEVYEYLKISPTFDIFQAKGIKGWHYLMD